MVKICCIGAGYVALKCPGIEVAVVDVEKLRQIGFIVYSIGKPLDDWLKDLPAVA